MLVLTRYLLARALRACCINKYKTIDAASTHLNIDVRDLRRAWEQSQKPRMSYDTLISYINRLGYDVFFTIRKKGDSNNASDQRLSTSEDQGISARQP